MKYKSVVFIVFLLIFSASGCGNNRNHSAENTAYNQQLPAPASQLPLPAPIQKMQPSPEMQIKAGQVIGSFDTELLDTDPERVNNINIAINTISGTIIQPGEVFSFNDILGKRTAEKGYKEARIIVDGEAENGIGGGICQLSSTLCNAAEKAGLEIVERHKHGKSVHYVPEGQDATVNYGTLDLKFKNTKNFPIALAAEIKDNKVHAAIKRDHAWPLGQAWSQTVDKGKRQI